MSNLKEILVNFGFEPDAKCIPWGNGHINDTFRVEDKFILQRINTDVFKDYEALMNNICLVTAFLQKMLFNNGGDVLREAISVIPAIDGKSYYKCADGLVYRTYIFIQDSLSLDKVETKQDLYSCGFGFGDFQQKLSGFDASQLVETIPHFHDTLKRYEAFKDALNKDVKNRACDCKEEIDFAINHYEMIKNITDIYSKLPLRVTHNDTKLNNVLFDIKTREPLCVIDLDTVMPGYAANDFGDAIRFGASTAAEDETDLSKVHFDFELYKAFAEGFIKGCGNGLTKEEKLSFPYGCLLMTFECGMRFLTDYLNGDTYFKIHREHHNLDRCRTQFKLVSEMEQCLDKMISFIKEQ
ncbi:MAG: aminoglycoside phosphotransferase family protein [Clostridiales bacterium]|nr:aminoglycoside phosphotransferase family protein [Clostridiales bacterium]